eukprot:scaffold71228_cov84-Attheya_sp.AAC.2
MAVLLIYYTEQCKTNGQQYGGAMMYFTDQQRLAYLSSLYTMVERERESIRRATRDRGNALLVCCRGGY